MKKKILFLFWLTGTGFIINAHPVHVSVINIVIEESSIQMSVRTFVDDWELAHFHYFGKPVNLKEEAQYSGAWFREYFHESIHLRTRNNGSRLRFETDTVYFNDLSMIIEMRTELDREPDSLYIYNAILTDIYPDQTNLLIYSFRGKETGIRFDYFKHEENVKLN